mmetsp:Transcript_9629/g.29000  ORF Transcript_9629/g.29000 Transcript_9629/m.29000 type:complete len:208 (-) Transcript_9629:221-844(-)
MINSRSAAAARPGQSKWRLSIPWGDQGMSTETWELGTFPWKAVAASATSAVYPAASGDPAASGTSRSKLTPSMKYLCALSSSFWIHAARASASVSQSAVLTSALSTTRAPWECAMHMRLGSVFHATVVNWSQSYPAYWPSLRVLNPKTSRSCWIVIGRQSFGSGQGHGGRSGAISTAASQVMASMQVTVAIVSATAMEAATRRMMAD